MRQIFFQPPFNILWGNQGSNGICCLVSLNSTSSILLYNFFPFPLMTLMLCLIVYLVPRMIPIVSLTIPVTPSTTLPPVSIMTSNDLLNGWLPFGTKKLSIKSIGWKFCWTWVKGIRKCKFLIELNVRKWKYHSTDLHVKSTFSHFNTYRRASIGR